MRHLYIHVPFCRRRCSYCDFAIAVRPAIPASRFVSAIASELRAARSAQSFPGEGIDTLYLGGGTPSRLPDAALDALVELVRGEVGFAPGIEVTLEANPEDVTPGRVDRWLEAGVNRVSLGVQSTAPEALRWMHRVHGADDGPRAAGMLRGAGVPSFSVDLIFGLPDHLGADPLADLAAVLETEPHHLSAYGLTVEPATTLAKWSTRGLPTTAPSSRFADEFLALDAALTAAGYDHYEVSNYARPGHRSRHNRAYWSGAPYLGLGPSAHSFRHDERWWNVRHWAAYDEMVAAGRSPREGGEHLSEADAHLERVYLGLRTSDGVTLADSRTLEPRRARAAIRAGWLRRSEGRLRPTPEGWVRLDELVAALTTSDAGG